MVSSLGKWGWWSKAWGRWQSGQEHSAQEYSVYCNCVVVALGGGGEGNKNGAGVRFSVALLTCKFSVSKQLRIELLNCKCKPADRIDSL